MQSIPEEDDLSTTSVRGSDSPVPNGARTKNVPQVLENLSKGHQGPVPTSHPRSPQISSHPQLGSIKEVKEEVNDDPMNARQEVCSPFASPSHSGVLSPASSCSSMGDDEEVRSKFTVPIKPPDPKDIPKVNVQMELDTLLNGEGRISLLAILHAVSRLPQTQELWLGDMGEKCFTIIQLCMDLGLRTSGGDDTLPKPASSGQEKRKQFQHQKNPAFHEHSGRAEEKPSKKHSRYIVEFSVKALVRCGTSLIVGCTSESSQCKLRHIHLPDQSTSTYNTLTRLLKRVYTFSPRCFRQALCEFAKPSGSSCRRLFQFLHIMLQYCVHPIDSHPNVFLMSIVSAVLRETIDRLVQFDITEACIKNVRSYILYA